MGELVPSFNGVGYISVTINNNYVYEIRLINSVILQGSKIFIGGTCYHPNYLSYDVHKNGSINNTFGDVHYMNNNIRQSYFYVVIPILQNNFLSKALIQPDGKLLIVGLCRNTNQPSQICVSHVK